MMVTAYLSTFRLLIAAVVMSSAVLSGCSTNPVLDSPPAPQPAQQDTLRMALFPFVSSAPLFIAEEEGYWAEEGITVEYVRLDSGAQALSAMMQGDLDIAYPAIGAGVVNAIGRGGKARMVASGTQWSADSCAYSALVARKDGISKETLTGGDPLSGLRIAASPVDMSAYYIDRLLATGGNSLSDQNVKDLPSPSLGEALESGNLDLVQTSEPWLTRILAAGSTEMVVGANEVIPDAQFTTVLFGPALLEAGSDLGQRFLIGYLKAVRQYNEGKTERNVEIIAKHTDLDPEFINSLCWPSFPLDGQIQLDSIKDFQAWALDRGLIDREVPMDELLNNDFLQQAQQAIEE